ncbi:premnaspirodiene oxygenase-like [Nicotiana tabacum]|uniref:Premnaspirodiene oxygenase-like n=1 Tax=Nicotiana tabacum TaxID=4097 RepID=A0A1S3YXI1_TOBAC|nr:PREDICTED: premnaspirodiene oxygenase-like [Nicotiana tabacum]
MAIYSSLFDLVSLLLFFSSLFVLVRLWRISKTRNQNKRLPPGPWRLPFIGSLHHLIGGELPHRTLKNLAQKYGPLMYLQLGQVPTIIISSPRIAKEVLKTHDLAFANRPQLTSSTIIFYNNIDMVFSQYGDYWRQMRKICIVELLSSKMVKSFSGIREKELSSLISSIRSMTEVNITEKIFMFTNSVTCRSAFGKICKDRGEFRTLLKEVLLLAGGFFVADLFPCWKLLHNLSGMESRLVNAHRKVDEIMENIINEHIANRAAGNKRNGEFGDEDLVDVFLRIKEKDQLHFPITNGHIKAMLFDIFLGGTETSSTVLIWALAELMKNPNVMAKAQSEVRQVFKGKKIYDEEDNIVEKLSYLKLVIMETLRLHTPAPLMGPRECREETNIAGYNIPNKTKVLVNAWALARDVESWNDPESFIPERFYNSSIDFMGNYFEYIPFGTGRRICPGIQFGLANIGVPLAQLLYNFEWKLPYGINPQDLDMTETHGLTGAKQNDLYLVATYREIF